MKQQIQQLMQSALDALHQQGVLSEAADKQPMIERARDAAHGDFASNAAMMFSKKAGMKPRDLAEKIIENIADTEWLQEISIAGPGKIPPVRTLRNRPGEKSPG
jgi:arginyl-tRNA synthetase